MQDVLEKEITGEPITVKLRGTERPLAFQMHAVILYKQKTGDSLFDPKSWPKIDLQTDPERWMAALWAALHQQQPDMSWKAPFTLDELAGLINFDFAETTAITVQIGKALSAYMPKPKPAEPDSPKAPAPGELALIEGSKETARVNSFVSGSGPVPGSASAATSS
jgi:hypothetical protein